MNFKSEQIKLTRCRKTAVIVLWSEKAGTNLSYAHQFSQKVFDNFKINFNGIAKNC